MGYKIFISYKYSDSSVKQLKPHNFSHSTTARDYVDIIQNKFERDGIHVNKGENDNESLADFKEETIRSKLADKIFDSSVTIVLLSPNMKDPKKAEKDQWIPWEIAYSLKSKKRAHNTSKRNAILLVSLPDKNGDYNYVNSCGFYFEIIQKNLNNLIEKYEKDGEHYKSYMLQCDWDRFISDPNKWIDRAKKIKKNEACYNIVSRFN